MSFLLREAIDEDAPATAVLLGELGYSTGEDLVLRKIREHRASETSCALVAVTEDKVVGSVSVHLLPLFHAEGNLGRITSLIVSSASRGQGVGRLLIEAAEEFARAGNCARMEITTRHHRDDAHGFYETMGYAISPHHRLIKKI